MFSAFLDELRVMKDEAGNSQAEIVGLDTWGALRGLESFSQLVYSTKENGFVVSLLNYMS